MIAQACAMEHHTHGIDQLADHEPIPSFCTNTTLLQAAHTKVPVRMPKRCENKLVAFVGNAHICKYVNWRLQPRWLQHRQQEPQQLKRGVNK